MKIVVSSDEVAKLWVLQTQPKARTSSNSLFFEGTTIYSYNRAHPIGNWHDGYILIFRDKYSRTTAKHVRQIEKACHLKEWNYEIVSTREELRV